MKILPLVSFLFLLPPLAAQNLLNAGQIPLSQRIESSAGQQKLTLIISYCEAYAKTRPDKTIEYANMGIDMLQTLNQPRLHTQILLARAHAQCKLGYMNKAYGSIMKAKELSLNLNDPLLLIHSHNEFSYYHFILGNFHQAIAESHKAISLSKQEKEVQLLINSNLALANAYIGLRDYVEALTIYEELLELCGQHELSCPKVKGNMGICVHNIGKPSEALSLFFEARREFEKQGVPDGVATFNHHIAYLLRRTGLIRESIHYYQLVLDFFSKTGDINQISSTNEGLGELYLKLDSLPLAQNYLEKALAIKQENGFKTTAYIQHELGLVAMKNKDFSSAIESFSGAMDQFVLLKDTTGQAIVLNSLAKANLHTNNLGKARIYALRALEILSDKLQKREIVKVYQNLVTIYERQEAYALALESQRQLDLIKKELESPQELFEITRKLVSETLRENDSSLAAILAPLTKVDAPQTHERRAITTLWLAGLPLLILLAAWAIYHFNKKAETKSAVSAITSQSGTSLPSKEAHQLQDKLTRLIQIEKVYLNEDLTLGALAIMLGTSDKKLSTLLNQHMDISFYDYINKHRIEACKQALQDEKYQSYSISGIAFECGFKSKSSFYRAFKSETGMSPTEFRKKYQS